MSGETLEEPSVSTTPTVPDLGTFLRQVRRSRKLSQQQVAQRAGVARSTLNRWEQGAHLPRLPELDLVLDALEVSPELRIEALTLIHAPRAIHTLRTERTEQNTPDPAESTGGEAASSHAWVFTPETGDLLRMMRLRRGMTQEYLADQVGVKRFSVSRWESGERIPSDEHLDQMMILLGALPEERKALAQGVLLPSRLNADTEKSFQAVHEHYTRITWGDPDPRLEPFKDLEFLRVERAFADLISHHPEARNYLVYTYGFHAEWLTFTQRFSEAAAYADRVIEATHRQTFPIPDWQRSILTAAQCAVYGGGRPHPERGIEMLQGWLPLIDWPEYQAWILSDIAKYMAQAGDLPAALETIARSCRVALRCSNPEELRGRRADRAELLLRTGRPDDAQTALDLLPPNRSLNLWLRVREQLCWSKGLLRLGEVAEAKRWLDRAAEDVRAYNLDSSGVAELASLFAKL